MRRRTPTNRPRPMSAEEFAALAGIELEPLEAEQHRGSWTVREHSQLRRQWRFVRRLPIILQIILALFWLTFVAIMTGVFLLVGGALMMPPHADSPPRHANAE